MANDVKIAEQALANFTITLASLASGSAEQSTMITNTSPSYPAALVMLIIESGTAPTAGQVYEVYLLRADAAGTYRTDGAGASDAAISIVNAQLLGTITVTNNGNTKFYGDFDTAILGPLGPSWGIAIKNQSGQSLNSTEGNHTKEYIYYNPQVQ